MTTPKRPQPIEPSAAEERRKERFASVIAWVIVFFASPFILACWALGGRRKRPRM